MGKGGIGINVSGGNVNIGNLAQGDGNTLSAGAQAITAQGEQAFAEFFARLEDARDRQQGQTAQIAALAAEIAALQAALAKTATDKKSLADTLRGLYEKYGWAGDLLKKLFVVLLPGWLP